MSGAARSLVGAAERPRPPWLPPLPRQFDPVDPELLGLIDRPAEQSQVGWKSPSGSIMVLGPPGSGRSSALRRIAYASAVRGADLLVVDAGGGLADLVDWPTTRTHLTGDDVLLVQRLVSRVATEVRLRAASPGPPMLLLIDGWKSIAGPLDALDYGTTMGNLADLAARGPGAGIGVVVSGEPELEHHRMAISFATTLRLGIESNRPAGRGRLGSDELQLARCDQGVRPPAPVNPPARHPLHRRPPPAHPGQQARSPGPQHHRPSRSGWAATPRSPS